MQIAAYNLHLGLLRPEPFWLHPVKVYCGRREADVLMSSVILGRSHDALLFGEVRLCRGGRKRLQRRNALLRQRSSLRGTASRNSGKRRNRAVNAICAVSEGDVAIGLTRKVQHVRALELPRIAIRGGNPGDYKVTL
jgi:hypothetical protein